MSEEQPKPKPIGFTIIDGKLEINEEPDIPIPVEGSKLIHLSQSDKNDHSHVEVFDLNINDSHGNELFLIVIHVSDRFFTFIYHNWIIEEPLYFHTLYREIGLPCSNDERDFIYDLEQFYVFIIFKNKLLRIHFGSDHLSEPLVELKTSQNDESFRLNCNSDDTRMIFFPNDNDGIDICSIEENPDDNSLSIYIHNIALITDDSRSLFNRNISYCFKLPGCISNIEHVDSQYRFSITFMVGSKKVSLLIGEDYPGCDMQNVWKIFKGYDEGCYILPEAEADNNEFKFSYNGWSIIATIIVESKDSLDDGIIHFIEDLLKLNKLDYSDSDD